jgi:predicted O-methyltransferase YrrM
MFYFGTTQIHAILMYSPVKLGLKYIRYWFTAANGKGHGIHPPFVYAFISHVLNDKRNFYCFNPIEQLRAKLKLNKTMLQLQDFGAGSRVHASYQRSVSAIAYSSLKPRKFARLLFRMVHYYQPDNIIDLGTSLGITTCYLASANTQVPVITFEGAEAVANIARQHFSALGLNNIQLVPGNFDDTLPQTLQQINKPIAFAFVDGNHRKIPTIAYFHQLLEHCTDQSIFIFDDIHWSEEMEEAWAYIQAHEAVTLTIDLFYIGIVFFRKEQLVKQHFTIRF